MIDIIQDENRLIPGLRQAIDRPDGKLPRGTSIEIELNQKGNKT